MPRLAGYGRIASVPETTMTPHTVLLIRAAVPEERLAALSTTLRVPVVALLVTDGDDLSATVDISVLSEPEQDALSVGLYTLYRMVSVAATVDDPVMFARTRLPELRAAVRAVERAIKDRDDRALLEAAELLRYEAELVSFGLDAWDAAAEG